jgi:hypothetical protein
MTLWLDAQLPPLLAAWINAQGWGIQAVAVREIGLRDASDPVIFQAARAAGMEKGAIAQPRAIATWNALPPEPVPSNGSRLQTAREGSINSRACPWLAR